jgi:hypothetical protein
VIVVGAATDCGGFSSHAFMGGVFGTVISCCFTGRFLSLAAASVTNVTIVSNEIENNRS